MKKGKLILGELGGGEVDKTSKTLSLLNRENKLSMLSSELLGDGNNNNLNSIFYTSNQTNIE